VKIPQPEALRLVTTARLGRSPRPMLGVPGWSEGAASVAVVLDATNLDPEDAAAVALQVPSAADLTDGAVTFVSGVALRSGGVLGRLFGGGSVAVSRSARCGALVARGYVDIGAAVDPASKIDVAWGRVLGRG
jgi:hypothetical protein